MTLIEVTIAIAILAIMMGMSWGTISTASRAARHFEKIQTRDHEIRVALERVVLDLQSAYLSKNEDENATNHRTLLKARKTGQGVELRFSSLAHRVLWSDARESEQTQIFYSTEPDREKTGATAWLRREQRRLSTENPDDEPADLDVLVHDIEKVEIQFWDHRDEKWLDEWDTTTADGQKGRLPTRVKIVVTVKTEIGNEYKVGTQARILLQEPLNVIN